MENLQKKIARMILIGCACGFGGACDDLPQTNTVPSPVVPTLQANRVSLGRMQFVPDYRQGIELAAAERKPMLLFFTAAWCHYCHQMAAEAFNDANVVGLSEQFVCVLVDADREPDICQYYGVRSYPTIQFVSATGRPLNRMVGKRAASELAQQMYAALNRLATTPVETPRRQ